MSWPGNDTAVLCAAIERETEFWARLRRGQGSKPPRCTPARSVDYLFGHNLGRAAAAMRRAEAAGYVARRQFDCGGNAWRLTRKGTALAQEGELLCRECAAAPSLPDDDALDRCAACAVELCEARAQSADHAAAYHGKRAGARTDEAAKHRARAEHFRSLTEPQAAAA